MKAIASKIESRIVKKPINKLVLFALLSIFFCSASCSKLSLEHEEARNIEIADIDFHQLSDGDFTGYYQGGIYGWRENECLLKVSDNEVTKIELLSSEAEYTSEFLDSIYGRVIRYQTLQVDIFSGATLDSKACLKAIENALEKSVAASSAENK